MSVIRSIVIALSLGVQITCAIADDTQIQREQAALQSIFVDHFRRGDLAADRNGDGKVNVLDVHDYLNLSRSNQHFRPKGTTGVEERIIIDGGPSVVLADSTFSVLVRIEQNTTPLFGYSIDLRVVPVISASGTIIARPDLTNFYFPRNLIIQGGATLDPLFSLILDPADGSVFVTANTSDGSTVLAQDGINDVLAQVFFETSPDALGEFVFDLGGASVLSDGEGFSVPFTTQFQTILVSTPPDCNENSIPDDVETAPEFVAPNVESQPSDECIVAEFICPSFEYSGTSIGATAGTGGAFFCGLHVGTLDVWHRYRPSWDGLAFVGLQGPPQDWIYGVWDDCPENGGTEIGCTEHGHFNLTWFATRGTEYYIRIAAIGADVTGSFAFTLIGPDCCPNRNDCLGDDIPDECQCFADVNGDTIVDALDFLQALAAVGTICSSECPEDVDGSGFVDETDLRIVLESAGECPLAAP